MEKATVIGGPVAVKQDDSADHDRYQTLFEQVNAAAFLTTYDGTILEANHKASDLFGYQSDELLKMELPDLFAKNLDWEQFRDEIAAFGGLKMESRGRIKNERTLPIEMSVSLFRWRGKPAMYVLVWDISKRKRFEEKLRESEEKYRSIFECTTDGMIILDEHGNIKKVNSKLCKMIGVDEKSLDGHNIFNLSMLTRSSREVTLSQFEQLLCDGYSHKNLSKIRGCNEKIIDVEMCSFFLSHTKRNENDFVIVIREMNERKEETSMLREEHELFISLMDTIPVAVAFSDVDHHCISWNRLMREFLGTDDEWLHGHQISDAMTKECRRASFDAECKVLQFGNSTIGRVEEWSLNDGRNLDVVISRVPRFDSEGNIAGLLTIVSAKNECEPRPT